MGEAARTKVSKKELEAATDMWGAFTEWMKYLTVSVVMVLVTLAVLFL